MGGCHMAMSRMILGLLVLGLVGCIDHGAQRGQPSPRGVLPKNQQVAEPAPPPLTRPEARLDAGIPPVPFRKPSSSLVENEADPQWLLSLDFEATEALLGAPALKLEQPPARVWVYNADGCILNVFFYPRVEEGTYRVLNYDVHGIETNNNVARRCFAKLLQKKIAAADASASAN